MGMDPTDPTKNKPISFPWESLLPGTNPFEPSRLGDMTRAKEEPKPIVSQSEDRFERADDPKPLNDYHSLISGKNS